MDAGFKKIHTLTFLLNKQNTETTIQIVTIRKPHRTIYVDVIIHDLTKYG